MTSLEGKLSSFVTKITFVVAEIIIKEDVITSYLAKITFIIVAEIICEVAVVTSSVA